MINNQYFLKTFFCDRTILPISVAVEELYLNRILRPYETLGKEGYTDEQIAKLMLIDGCHRKTSDYSLFWRAGNSIVVNVLSAVFTSIIKQYPASFGEVSSISPKTNSDETSVS